MINEKRYEMLKGYLIDKITYFNLHCNKFIANKEEKDKTKFLIENEVTAFVFARDFVSSEENKRKKQIIDNYLSSLIDRNGQDLRLIIKNSIITWNKFGLYLTVFPYSMLKGRRKTVITRIKDDNFNPVPLLSIDKKIPVDNLISSGISEKVCAILKDAGVEFIGWETDLISLKKIKGISNGTIRKLQDAMVAYGYMKGDE